MEKEDIEFLKQLQYEMLTQDACGEASPRFWVVMTTKRIYWVDEDKWYEKGELTWLD